MSKIFISHSSKDSELVQRFVELLQLGMGCSARDIFCTSLYGTLPPGEPFVEKIKENIIDAEAVIFLISEAYLASPFCLAELGAAWALNRAIYPMIVDPVTEEQLNKLPILGRQYLPLLQKTGLQQLIDSFAKKNLSDFNMTSCERQIDRFLNGSEGYGKHDEETSSLEMEKNDQLRIYLEKLKKEAENDNSAKFILGTIYWEGILIRQDKGQALKLLTEAAMEGHALAQHRLASLYYKGDAGEQSFRKSFFWQEKAGKVEKDPVILHTLGFLYRDGLGCDQNIEKALEYYTEAAQYGYYSAFFDLGDIYRNKGQYKDAVNAYMKALETGYSYAAMQLGLIYKEGNEEINIDYAQALFYFHLAADAGITEAKDQIGLLYYYGHGVFKQDFQQANRWFEEAAKEGNTHAQYNLAYMYHHGLGTDYDWDKAVYWYEQAAKKGHQFSQINLADLLVRADRRQYEKAIYWYKKAAEQNSGEANRKLGDIYSFGLGGYEDQARAIMHYKSAAERGEKMAKFRLESLRP